MPPIPREHGAWLMLYAPILILLLAAPLPSAVPCFLLVVAATAGFCLQNVIGLILRRRDKTEYVAGLAIYLSLLAASSLPLLLTYHLTELIPLALLTGLGFGIQAILTICLPRQRFERTLWGEIVGAVALTLTGPAAWVAATGSLDSMAWRLWVYCALFFISGVLLVNMLLAAAKSRRKIDLEARWRLGWGHLLYHGALTLMVGSLAVTMDGRAGLLFALAYAPILIRALKGWLRLSDQLPKLKHVGRGEILYTLWFVACLAAWLRITSPMP